MQRRFERPQSLDFDASASSKGLRVGYFCLDERKPRHRRGSRRSRTIRNSAWFPVEVSLPNWGYNSLNLILFAEGAAAFEELTLTHGIDQLKVQTPDAWPNLFRQSRSSLPWISSRLIASAASRAGNGAHLLPGGPAPVPRSATKCSPSATRPATLRHAARRIRPKLPKRVLTGPRPKNPLPKFFSPRAASPRHHLNRRPSKKAPSGRAGIGLERAFAVSAERPPSF